MRLAERKRIGTVIRAIHQVFEPRVVGGADRASYVRFRKRKIFSRDALKQVPGSHVTILKAREYLGVRSKVIAGRHHWLAPTVSLQAALERAGKHSGSKIYKVGQDRKDRLNKYADELVPVLIEILKAHNCDIPPDKVGEQIHQLTGRKFSNGIINLAKQKAKIVSRKLVDGWHWLLEPERMQEWLEERLSKGPVLHSTLVDEVVRAGWTSNILNLFRVGKGFGQKLKDGEWWWYDINTWSE